MHHISKDHVIYEFSDKLSPVLVVKPGQEIILETQDCYQDLVTSQDLPMDQQFPHGTPNNPATGSIFIEGAQAGDVLVVEILSIQVRDWGMVCNEVNSYPLGAQVEERHLLQIEEGQVSFQGISWPIQPMIGVIGVADEPGRAHPTMNVHQGGGNMDNPLIGQGAKVYLPVRVEGGLLALGDLHASMGEGEVCGNGLEVAGSVRIKVDLIKGQDLTWPVVETSDAWYVNTCGETTDLAIRRAYEAMADLIAKAYGWNRQEAAVYMTLRGSLSANQACLVPGGGGNSFRIGTPKIMDKPLIKPIDSSDCI